MPASLHSWHIREEQEPGAACHRPNVGLLPDTRPIGKRRKMTRWADTVAKVFLYDWAQIFRAVGTALEKLCGGLHHCELNSQATSVTRLRVHRPAITACSALWREICHAAIWDFCNTIGPLETSCSCCSQSGHRGRADIHEITNHLRC